MCSFDIYRRGHPICRRAIIGHRGAGGRARCYADVRADTGYQELHKEKSKLAPSLFVARVGADVPPIIELHALPEHVLASNPETKRYEFTKVDDRVVLVDPAKMRVIAVIDFKAKD